ncbi:MAG: hypothetical protein KDB61_16930, partial [Planctomycetes bacterium]|nr:hypothetical protein [Planctomycetota bacterium]
MLIYGGALFPALGFFDVYPMKFSWAADHFQYHADLSLFALFAAGLTLALQRWGGAKAMTGVAAALLLLCGVRTGLQGRHYQDEHALWTATTEANPQAWAAWQNLGQWTIEQGNPIEGERLFRHALDLQRDPVLLTSLAVLQ